MIISENQQPSIPSSKYKTDLWPLVLNCSPNEGACKHWQTNILLISGDMWWLRDLVNGYSFCKSRTNGHLFVKIPQKILELLKWKLTLSILPKKQLNQASVFNIIRYCHACAKTMTMWSAVSGLWPHPCHHVLELLSFNYPATLTAIHQYPCSKQSLKAK